jgi:PhoPQ-activated pathogenicity-related protein
VVIKVNQIPNQPLYFADEDNVARREDAIIAYSFDKFLKTGDEEWPALLPMTKAVVRAMDTIQAFLVERRSLRIDDFIVVGGSKRGWTTWLTAAADKRIKAIAPASIDLLNMGEQFRRHFEAYGFYAPAIADYVALDIPNRIATPEGQALLRIVDPYAYRERFTMPKIILNSTGDQFFYLIHHNSILRTCRKPSGCATCPIPTTSKVWTWQKVSPPGLTKLMRGRLLHDITGQSKPMALFGLKL